jgi:hypothetical protein
MMAIEKDPAFPRPKPLLGVPPARLADKYYAFHNCYGHFTEKCISLRQLIEKFIENGKLVWFLINERNHQDRARALRPREEEERRHRRDYAPRREERQERAREPTPKPRAEERREMSRSKARENDNLPEIHTISGGFGGGGESSSARKAYTRLLDDFGRLRILGRRLCRSFTPTYRRPHSIIGYCQPSDSAYTDRYRKFC